MYIERNECVAFPGQYTHTYSTFERQHIKILHSDWPIGPFSNSKIIPFFFDMVLIDQSECRYVVISKVEYECNDWEMQPMYLIHFDFVQYTNVIHFDFVQYTTVDQQKKVYSAASGIQLLLQNQQFIFEYEPVLKAAVLNSCETYQVF